MGLSDQRDQLVKTPQRRPAQAHRRSRASCSTSRRSCSLTSPPPASTPAWTTDDAAAAAARRPGPDGGANHARDRARGRVRHAGARRPRRARHLRGRTAGRARLVRRAVASATCSRWWRPPRVLPQLRAASGTATQLSERARPPPPEPRPQLPGLRPARRCAAAMGGASAAASGRPPGARSWLEQGKIFAGRYVRLIGRDRPALAFSLLQGVAVALLTALAVPAVQLGHGQRADVRLRLRRRLVRHDRRGSRAGQGEADLAPGVPGRRRMPAYLASKVVVLGALAAIQALTLTVVVGGPWDCPPAARSGIRSSRSSSRPGSAR